MPKYQSIRTEVLQKLDEHLTEIQERFDIETLGIFGSISRGEDTPESDVDILYRFKPGIRTYQKFLALAEYLENLFGRKVDLIAVDWIDPYMRTAVLNDAIVFSPGGKGEV